MEEPAIFTVTGKIKQYGGIGIEICNETADLFSGQQCKLVGDRFLILAPLILAIEEIITNLAMNTQTG